MLSLCYSYQVNGLTVSGESWPPLRSSHLLKTNEWFPSKSKNFLDNKNTLYRCPWKVIELDRRYKWVVWQMIVISSLRLTEELSGTAVAYGRVCAPQFATGKRSTKFSFDHTIRKVYRLVIVWLHFQTVSKKSHRKTPRIVSQIKPTYVPTSRLTMRMVSRWVEPATYHIEISKSRNHGCSKSRNHGSAHTQASFLSWSAREAKGHREAKYQKW